MAQIQVNAAGIVITLDHKEVSDLLQAVGPIEDVLNIILPPVIGAIAVLAPYAGIISAGVAAYFKVNKAWIAYADKGSGVYLTIPWPAVVTFNPSFIIATSVPPPAVGVCPAGGGHVYMNSSDYAVVDIQTTPGASGQRSWRFCDRCSAMFWADPTATGPDGVCPAGGQHNRGATDYVVAMNDPAAPGQDNWRWCTKCNGLIWADPTIAGPAAGVCPAGGQHNRGATDYTLVIDDINAPGQHNWRWCEKCLGLIWAG